MFINCILIKLAFSDVEDQEQEFDDSVRDQSYNPQKDDQMFSSSDSDMEVGFFAMCFYKHFSSDCISCVLI